ncbi:hypothetical protein [Ruegeria sp. EL01]|uniref:hypothetical protein n=1 Tax=Ruegeria sp. EL01 TaxID=2107578 RepID=UPI000EA80334|nr:hypothetical protein [Ruegeria sp. EL01]
MRVLSVLVAVVVSLVHAPPGYSDAGEEWNRFELQRAEDLVALRACIETDEFSVTGTACAEMTVRECQDRLVSDQSNVSRVEQDSCWKNELKLWDLLYSETVELTLRGAIHLDRDAFYTDREFTGNTELFLRTEAGWLATIKDRCDLEMAHWIGGTAGSTTQYTCRINLRAERISDLRNLGLTNHSK